MSTIVQTPDRITMTFPSENLPSDEQIANGTLLGILDGGMDRGLQSLGSVIKDLYPESDQLVYFSAPGDIDQLNLAPREIPADHDCGDPHCPHMQPIHPLQAMMVAMTLNRKELDLSKWEPFKYPIVSVSETMWQTLGFVLQTVSMKTPFNFLRVAIGLEIDTSVKWSLRLPKSCEMLEGLYFWDRIPKSIELQSNECPGPIIHPDRKYTFLGMSIKAGYSFSSIVLQPNSGVYKFAVIGWVCECNSMLRDIEETPNITSRFNSPMGNESIVAEYAGKMSRWIKYV